VDSVRIPYPLRPDHCFTERLTDLMSHQPCDSKDAKKRHALHLSHTDTFSFLTLISSLSSTSRLVPHPSLYDTLTITNSWTLFSRYYFLFPPRHTQNGQMSYETLVTPAQTFLLTGNIHSIFLYSLSHSSFLPCQDCRHSLSVSLFGLHIPEDP